MLFRQQRVVELPENWVFNKTLLSFGENSWVLVQKYQSFGRRYLKFQHLRIFTQLVTFYSEKGEFYEIQVLNVLQIFPLDFKLAGNLSFDQYFLEFLENFRWVLSFIFVEFWSRRRKKPLQYIAKLVPSIPSSNCNKWSWSDLQKLPKRSDHRPPWKIWSRSRSDHWKVI